MHPKQEQQGAFGIRHMLAVTQEFRDPLPRQPEKPGQPRAITAAAKFGLHGASQGVPEGRIKAGAQALTAPMGAPQGPLRRLAGALHRRGRELPGKVQRQVEFGVKTILHAHAPRHAHVLCHVLRDKAGENTADGGGGLRRTGKSGKGGGAWNLPRN